MEYKDRGLLFGWPLNTPNASNEKGKSYKLSSAPIDLVRKYHGYFFSWAAIYTFWYHPMENTVGHCMGFILTWMFMLQGKISILILYIL